MPERVQTAGSHASAARSCNYDAAVVAIRLEVQINMVKLENCKEFIQGEGLNLKFNAPTE